MVILPQGKSLKNTNDVYAASEGLRFFFFLFLKLPLKTIFLALKAAPNAWCCFCFLPTKGNFNF